MGSSHSPRQPLQDTLRQTLAVCLGKLAAAMAGWLKLGTGTSLPGKVALKVSPDILSHLAGQISGPIVAVTGTNGKTTTCGLLGQFFEEAGRTVANNHLGANMVPGITAALLKQSSLQATLSADMGILEVDEASLQRLASPVNISHGVVTNLFRDQLDRYGELDTTAALIGAGFEKTAVATDGYLFLNADDPMVAAMGVRGVTGRQVSKPVYFGLESVQYGSPRKGPSDMTDVAALTVPFPKEVTDCPLPDCRAPLAYTANWYGHLGHYACTRCDFKRPPLDISIARATFGPTGSELMICTPDKTLELSVPLPGLFNAYNVLAAVTVYDRLGIRAGLPVSAIQDGLNHYHGVFGRAETRTIAGKTVRIFLIKNPVGASEVLKLVRSDPKARLMVALNDNYADGRDVSWIWDAAFEWALMRAPVVVSGVRAADMAVRLKYAGLEDAYLVVEPNLQEALNMAVAMTGEDETLYVLPTYTALLALRV